MLKLHIVLFLSVITANLPMQCRGQLYTVQVDYSGRTQEPVTGPLVDYGRRAGIRSDNVDNDALGIHRHRSTHQYISVFITFTRRLMFFAEEVFSTAICLTFPFLAPGSPCRLAACDAAKLSFTVHSRLPSHDADAVTVESSGSTKFERGPV